jgi:transposase
MMADAVAERYHVSGSWVRWLKQRRRETGTVGPRWKLEPHGHTLAALIQEQPDRTLAELQEVLGLLVSLPTICHAVQRLGCGLRKPCAPATSSSPTISTPTKPRTRDARLSGWAPPSGICRLQSGRQPARPRLAPASRPRP